MPSFAAWIKLRSSLSNRSATGYVIAMLLVLALAILLALLAGGLSSRVDMLESVSGHIGVSVFFVSTVTLTSYVLALRAKDQVQTQPTIAGLSLEDGMRLRESEARKNVELKRIHYQCCFWVAVISAVATMWLLMGLLFQFNDKSAAGDIKAVSVSAALTALWAGISLKLYARATLELKLALRHAERLGDQVLAILLFREELGKISDLAIADELRCRMIAMTMQATFSGSKQERDAPARRPAANRGPREVLRRMETPSKPNKRFAAT